jgi:curved DNA-binding protein
MEFKDYYALLGVPRDAAPEDIKRAYRKLARKYHPDVSKEADAEARFKEVAEAYEALGDPERRAAYDEVGRRHRSGGEFHPPPGWDSGFEFSGRGPDGAGQQDFSEFFETLFGRAGHGGTGAAGGRGRAGPARGQDHHAKITIDLEDAYRGSRRSVNLRVPQPGGGGRMTLQPRELEVAIPRGVRPGQHLRLTGQGAPGSAGGPPGDLYLEVAFLPHRHFRVEGFDVYVDLPVAPWEAALGATVQAPTPEGPVQLAVPGGSPAGRKLRLKGRGLPGEPAGDLYAVLQIVLPSAETDAAREAFAALAAAFPAFNPRQHLER